MGAELECLSSFEAHSLVLELALLEAQILLELLQVRVRGLELELVEEQVPILAILSSAIPCQQVPYP